MANRVRINIAGSDYYVMTDENPHYTTKLAYRLDAQIREMTESGNVTMTTALILCALSYLDDSNKANAIADNFRGQIKNYLEESTQLTIKLDEANREIERLKKQLAEKN
ncbi:MAG TPA: hypothetical protein DCE08_07590 [Ruminococcaceae bacterium]|nr:cell division protein ZapA [Oscillospiraceae bacterium]HAB01292.1 hypothetical protein [Oscillospiraceae bacterium]